MKKNKEGHQCKEIWSTHKPRRCKKCSDSQHVEGIRCPSSKHQCKNFHKYGHFSSLCYKKRDFEHKRSLESRSPKAHQLQIGLVCMQDSLYGQSKESSSKDSFCLQVQLKSTQVETNIPAPQHLITNLPNKLKPHKRTQYLRARLDTYADVKLYLLVSTSWFVKMQIVWSLLPAAN